MSEAAPEAPAQEQPTPEATSEVDEQQSKPAETDWKAEAQKWEKRSKDNHAKATEFDKQRKAAMTDAERAVAEAEERGRTSAASEFGSELARTRFDALAGRRNPGFDTDQALEYVDLGKFLGEDGRPNDQAIAAAVERLVPTSTETAPSFDGGTRTPPPAQQGMSGLIRKAAGRA